MSCARVVLWNKRQAVPIKKTQTSDSGLGIRVFITI